MRYDTRQIEISVFRWKMIAERLKELEAVKIAVVKAAQDRAIKELK